MGRIRWGIIGAGTIAHRFAAALEHVDDAVLTAVSGRNPKRLAQFAREHSVDDGLCYSSAGDDGAAAHQRLIENPDIDAVYIALPHGMHAEWACRALRAGKSVLCEKPAVLSEAEALRIERAAHESKTLFMEAMKPRFTPARSCVRELVEGGELGAVLEMDVTHRLDYGSHLGGYLIDPLQGGTLYDLGCYGIGWIDDLLVGDAEVERVDVRWIDGAGGAPVDIAETARLSVGGVPVRLDFAGDSGDYNVECRIRCERGAIAVPMFHRPSSLVIERDGCTARTVDIPLEVDDFYGEIAHFCSLIRGGAAESPIMPPASTVRIARIIDAVREAWGRRRR